MTVTIHKAEWTKITAERKCGSCYACCVWLGIVELQKHTAQACKHLSGTLSDDGTKRCSIYADRPTACSRYQCLWVEGYGPDWLQPSNSGILLTPYASQMGSNFAITMMVFDEKKAKPIYKKVITELLQLHNDLELRVVRWASQTAILFVKGLIYDCKLLPNRDFESLDFMADMSAPVGRYVTATLPE